MIPNISLNTTSRISLRTTSRISLHTTSRIPTRSIMTRIRLRIHGNPPLSAIISPAIQLRIHGNPPLVAIITPAITIRIHGTQPLAPMAIITPAIMVRIHGTPPLPAITLAIQLNLKAGTVYINSIRRPKSSLSPMRKNPLLASAKSPMDSNLSQVISRLLNSQRSQRKLQALSWDLIAASQNRAPKSFGASTN